MVQILVIIVLLAGAAMAQVLTPANGGTGVTDLTFSGSTHKAGTVLGALTSGNCVKFDASGNLISSGAACGSGSGSVTSFSAGNLSPLFTTSVATATTTPALSFTLSNAAANTVFGNFTGSSAAPEFNTINTGSSCGDATHALSYTNGTGFGCQSISGTGGSVTSV